jgi:sorting nexin-1/2
VPSHYSCYPSPSAECASELAAAIGEFGQTISELSGSDLGKPLAHALAGLAEVERKAQAIQNAQSRQDVMTIMNTGELD